MKTIIFYGRTQVGAVVLSYLVAKGFTVKVIPEDGLTRDLCKYYNLEIVNLDTMGDFDLFICCHGEKIIPEKYLTPGKFINMHSCLWKYKGQNPIKRYMANKDTDASIESHFLIKEVDTGQVIVRVLFNTPVIKSYGEYFNLAIPYYLRCIDETLKALEKGFQEVITIDSMSDRAIFTSVKKDKYFPVWIKYYSQFFRHIFVIDNEPDIEDPFIKEASEKYQFTVIKDYPNPEYDLQKWNSVIRDTQRALLEKYKWVLYTDADEIVVPDPEKYKDLGEYINKCNKDFVFCSGYNVLQMYNEPESTDKELNEPPLDLSLPILKQRKFWWYEYGYNKPLLSRVPLNWKHGMHSIEEVEDKDLPILNDPDLILFHLKQADWEIFHTRIGGDVSNGKGPEWFYKSHDAKELIPEKFKEVF